MGLDCFVMVYCVGVGLAGENWFDFYSFFIEYFLWSSYLVYLGKVSCCYFFYVFMIGNNEVFIEANI